MGQANGTLTLQELLEAVSGKIEPDGERVIYTAPFRRPLTLTKPIWKEHFGEWAGIQVKRGEEIRLAPASHGGNRLEIPDWAVEQLGLGKGDTVCLTSAAGRCGLKKLQLIERDLAAPGWVVYDEFGSRSVQRTFARNMDLASLDGRRLHEVLSGLGRFRHGPLKPLRKVSGFMGARIRRELFGGATARDRQTLKECRQAIVAGQEADGSWQGSVVHTSYAIVRLLEAGCTRRNAALRKAVEWLLASPSPARMPAMFMSTNWLTEKHKVWLKEAPRSSDPVAFRDIFMTKKSKMSKDDLMAGFRTNTDLHGAFDNFCGQSIMQPTAVALEALLRCGLHEHPRVRELLEALLCIRWCQGDMGNVEAHVRRCPRVPTFDDAAEGRWTGAEQEWDMTAKRALGLPKYDMRLKQLYSLPLANGRAVWRRLRMFHSCGSGIATALSYHPGWPGSEMPRSVAMATLARQSPDWTCPRTYPSYLLSFLERHVCTIAAYAALRVGPTLISTQHRDGLWHEQAPVLSDPAYEQLLAGRVYDAMRREVAAPLAPEESTFLILRALKTFGFLDALLPSSRKGKRNG